MQAPLEENWITLAVASVAIFFGAVLATARTVWPDRRLVTLFQPHRYSRTRALHRQFGQVLTQTDVLLPVAPFSETSGTFVNAEGRVQIDGSKGAAIIPEVAPEPVDRIIRKWRPSAFFRTRRLRNAFTVFGCQVGSRRFSASIICPAEQGPSAQTIFITSHSVSEMRGSFGVLIDYNCR